MSQIEYDRRVLQALAAGLYAQADSIVASAATGGAVLGGIAGLIATAATVAKAGASAAPFALTLVLVFGFLGYRVGRKRGEVKAFALRIKAQTALCQVQIELNTRKP